MKVKTMTLKEFKENDNSCCWEGLPDLVLLNILQNLKFKDVISCCAVCFKWNEICEDNLLWKYLFQRDILSLGKKSILQFSNTSVDNSSWKEEYERLTDRVPCLKKQILKGHTDEVVHLAFAHNGTEFVSCSKDQQFIVWRKNEESNQFTGDNSFTAEFHRHMGMYGWMQTYSAQYSPLDTKILISGVITETSGEIAIFAREETCNNKINFTLVHLVPNQPFDMMGCWCSDKSFFTGSVEIYDDPLLDINQEFVSYNSSVWLCTIIDTGDKAKTNLVHENYLNPEYHIVEEETGENADAFGTYVKKEQILKFQNPEVTNPPHFIQCFPIKRKTTNSAENNSKTCEKDLQNKISRENNRILVTGCDSNKVITTNDQKDVRRIICDEPVASDNELNCCTNTNVTIKTEDGHIKDEEELCLVFICGDKTYVGHQIGFQNIPATSNVEGPMTNSTTITEKNLKSNLLKRLEMNGQIIGMNLSPENDFLFVNVRKWDTNENESVIPTPVQAPEISKEIEVRKINLKTMEVVKNKESSNDDEMECVLKGHKGFTSTDGAFYLYLDVSKHLVASGSEDFYGYIWDRHYGVLLEKLSAHTKCGNCVVFDPTDEELCVTASDDHSIQVWTSRRKERTASIMSRSNGWIKERTISETVSCEFAII